jgi:hypothetical protein
MAVKTKESAKNKGDRPARPKVVSRGKEDKTLPANGKSVARQRRQIASLSANAIADGLGSSAQFARVMTGIIQDVLDGTIKAEVANAACNAAGKLLKMVDMQLQYSRENKNRDLLQLGKDH